MRRVLPWLWNVAAALAAAVLALAACAFAWRDLVLRPPPSPPGSSVAAFPPPDPDDRRIMDALDRGLPEVDFEGVALGETVEFLRGDCQLPVFVNWPALRAAGIGPDAPVRLRLRDLRYAAPDAASGTGPRPTGGDGAGAVAEFAVGDHNILTVGPRGAAAPMYVRAYDVRDLLPADAAAGPPSGPEDGDGRRRTARAAAVRRLAGEVLGRVDPASWRDYDTGADRMLDEVGGRLVVAQTAENHRAVRDMLDRIRWRRRLRVFAGRAAAPVLGAAAAGAAARLLLAADQGRRLRRRGLCRRCGYDLTGNASGVCPECGTPVPKGVRP